MTATWDTFNRYRQRGLDARRAGQWDSAKVYLLEAARAMLELSKQAQTEELKTSRRATSERLLELARDCDAAKATKRPQPTSTREGSAGSSDEPQTSADQWIVKQKPGVRFDDVAGLEDVKDEIRLKMIYPFAHPELAEKFDIRGGGGLLMYGPPGTGKTLLARATAGELDATFFRISAADILSKWVGEAEQNVKKLFDAAAAEKRAVIFIDEIESLVPARRDDGSSVMQRVVPQVLQGMEGFDKSKKSAVLFLGATNVPWQLDPAVLRPGRFDQRVYIPLPDLPARHRMLELYLAKRPLADDVDFAAIAKKLEGYSGADVRQVCDRAAMIPFLHAVAGRPSDRITAAVLDEALAETPPSVTAEQCRRFDEWATATQ
ncbi:MAG TPA: ATP-binding protein [Tepidisphaeraceae bacterium]|jgi:transitional endoplasmic reticulum ATPase